MQKLLVVLLLLVGSTAAAELIYFDARVPENSRRLFQTDLDLMRGIEGTTASPRHRALIGEVRGADYLAFLKQRIQFVGYQVAREGRTAAFVQAPYYTTMFLTSNFSNADTPQMFRVQVYWHESRHGEWAVGGWQHVICPRGATDLHGEEIRGPVSGRSLIGFPGCDNVSDGAYGLSATMMGNLAKNCTNCSEKVKTDSKWLSEDSTGRLLGEPLRKIVVDDLK